MRSPGAEALMQCFARVPAKFPYRELGETAELRSFIGDVMRYVVAWILGVPLSVIALWYVVGHAACGR